MLNELLLDGGGGGGVGICLHGYQIFQSTEASNLKTVWGAHKSLGRCENDPRSVIK